MNTAFKNPRTGEIKEVKIGFSWTLLLFSWFFGLPLFLRKLPLWGVIFLVLYILTLMIPAFFLILAGFQIYIGFKGNEITAKNYVENGWEFLEPNLEITNMAKMKWGLLGLGIAAPIIMQQAQAAQGEAVQSEATQSELQNYIDKAQEFMAEQKLQKLKEQFTSSSSEEPVQEEGVIEEPEVDSGDDGGILGFLKDVFSDD